MSLYSITVYGTRGRKLWSWKPVCLVDARLVELAAHGDWSLADASVATARKPGCGFDVLVRVGRLAKVLDSLEASSRLWPENVRVRIGVIGAVRAAEGDE